MKKFLFGILTALLAVAPAVAGTNTSPIYINNSPVYTTDIPPQIDAYAFLNRSIFDVSTTLLPYQAQNVITWTNNGAMSSALGFLFELDKDGTTPSKKKNRKKRPTQNSRELQVPSAHFLNDGQITAGGLQTTLGITLLSSANPIIGINATNIQMPGRIDGDELTFVRMSAPDSADLSRGGVRVAKSVVPSCDFFFVSTNFTPVPGITELYWGAGRNNNLGTNGQAFFLSTLPSQFALSTGVFASTPFSGSHQVIQRSTLGSLLTNFASISPFSACAGDFRAFVHTNADFGNPTGSFVTVVFVATNNLLSTNLDVAVRFVLSSGDIGTFYAPVVEFRTIDFDLVNQAYATNYVTFADASGGETNITLARPLSGGGSVRRPTTHTWINGRYCNFDTTPIPGFTNFFFGVEPANVPDYDPNIFYSPLFVTNRASYLYAASRVQVGQSNSATFLNTTVLGQSLLGVNTGLSDPSNFTGNVTVDASTLNLNGTRIKAEEFISIRTDNLVSNTFAALDAPFIDFDVRTTQEQLVISNIAPATVNRLVGQLAAWSAVWDVNVTNTVGQSTNLNRVRYHVLMLDNCLQPQQPVTVNRFAVHAPSTVIFDNLSVNAGVTLDSPALTIQSNGALNLPFNQNLAFTNALNLAFFTNYGAVNLTAGAYFGTFETGHIPTNAPPKKKKKKRNQVPPPVVPPPLDTFVNHGAVAASSILVRSTNFENSGRPLAPATLTANGGVVLVTASQITVSNAEVTSTGDTEFHGDDLRIANTFMQAGTASTNITQYIRGSIEFDATNSLGDFGEMSTNDWFVSGGFRIPTIPLNKGDFLGSRLYVSAGALVTPRIVWAGEDRGATPNGYQNNLALGRLVLDGVGGNEFRFVAAGESNAIYVDVLELRNFATNFSFIFGIPTNFTIYFADITGGAFEGSPEQINGISGGRVQWVSDFVGPQSGTNILYPNGVTYRFNAGLARSREFDSDGDGTVNRFDCTPFPIPGEDPSVWFGNCVVEPEPASPTTSSAGLSRLDAISSAAVIGKTTFKAVSTAGLDIGLSISLSESDREITLNWNAPAGAASTVEYTDALGSVPWRTLTNFVNGPVNARVTVKDSAEAPLRVYRVRVDAATQQ